MRRSPARTGAFTFIEALMSVVLFSIVFVLLMSSFISGVRSFETRSARVDMLQDFHLLLAYMRRDLRTAVWGPDNPLEIVENQMTFHRVAGVKEGGEGNTGLPIIHVVQYTWNAERQSIVRRQQLEATVEEKHFLAEQVGEGGLFIEAIEGPPPHSFAMLQQAPMHVNIAVTCRDKLRAGGSVTLFSRYMGLAMRDLFPSRWYDNYRIDVVENEAITLRSDYRCRPLASIIDKDFDAVDDVGLVMGTTPPVLSVPSPTSL